MEEINISLHQYSNKHISVIILDSTQDWDVESGGNEPGYDLFIKFLSELIINLSKEKQIYASFTERREKTSLIRKLKHYQLQYINYPVFLPEVIMNSIFKKFGKDKGFGTGVAIKLQNEDDVLKIIECSEHPNEWVFFNIGELKKPSLFLEYQPFYLAKKVKNYDFSVFGNADFVVLVYVPNEPMYLHV